MSEVWSAIGSLGAVWAAVAASLAAYFTYHLMKTGQEQVKVSQEQFRQSVEAERDAHLPILVPSEQLVSLQEIVKDNLGGWGQPQQNGYDRTWPFARVVIRNAGPGIALNIWGVVFEAEPELDVLKQTGQHHSHRYAAPIEPGSERKIDWKGGGLPMGGDTEIGTTQRYKLYAPRKPTVNETLRGETEKVARLILTYSDIFGRKHAAIYDLTAQFQWENVDYLRDIKQDLGDLEREWFGRIPAYRAPGIPAALPSQSDD